MMKPNRPPPCLPLVLALSATGCSLSPELPPLPYQEAFRPQLSYSPRRHWMNDPNGLVYHAGEYHLFYQYNPNGTTWGDMSWGHAVSRDLLHWTELPLALPVQKDDRGEITEMIFSGSVVVDHANTSGLGQAGRPAMVGIYTSVYPKARVLDNGHSVQAGAQAQSLVYSLDQGRSWSRYAGNPVIAQPPASYAGEYREFRDPKLFWHEGERKWVMVLVLPNRHKALFYASRDLKQWEWMSEFGPAQATGGMWECPDLFELPVDGDPARSKWVLVMSLNPGGPAGGSGSQYFVGHFDGRRFIQDPAPDQPAAPGSGEAQRDERMQWLDYGADLYAAVSYNGTPDKRRLLVGWMNNWLYGQQVPTATWRSAQSVPRELSLRTIDGRIRLVQQPVAEFKRLRSGLLHSSATLPLQPGIHALPAAASPSGAMDLELRLNTGSASRAGIRLGTGSQGEQVEVGYDSKLGVVYVDRNGAGHHAFHPQFANRQVAPVALRAGQLQLRVLIDRASVTVFAGEGEAVLTSQFFASPDRQSITLFSEGGSAAFHDLNLWAMTSIWAGAK